MTQDLSGGLRAGLDQARAEAEVATKFYEMLLSQSKLASHVRLTYRRAGCRCALLHVINTPSGVLLGWPRYKLSEARNSGTSTASARAKRTEDGDRRWRPHAAPLSHLGDALEVRCNHSSRVLPVAQVHADLRTGDTLVLLDS